MPGVLENFQWWRYRDEDCRLEEARRWRNPDFGWKPQSFGFVDKVTGLPPDAPEWMKAKVIQAKQEWFTSEARIVPGTGPLVPYAPYSKEQLLLRQFVKVRDVGSALEFVNTYGPLSLTIAADGTPIDLGSNPNDLVGEARRMREALQYQEAGEVQNFRRSIGDGLTVKVVAGVSLEKRGAIARLAIGPQSLFNLIFIQWANALSGTDEIRDCPQCGEWFEVGPRKARNKKARFCSEQCKTVFFHEQRSQKEN